MDFLTIYLHSRIEALTEERDAICELVKSLPPNQKAEIEPDLKRLRKH